MDLLRSCNFYETYFLRKTAVTHAFTFQHFFDTQIKMTYLSKMNRKAVKAEERDNYPVRDHKN